jgi:hypothetical protein
MVSMLLTVLVYSSSAWANYDHVCQAHGAQLAAAVDAEVNAITAHVAARVLIPAFAESGIAIGEDQVHVTLDDKHSEFQISVAVSGKKFRFTGKVLQIGPIANLRSIDNAVYDSIGNVIKPATVVDCFAGRAVGNALTISNAGTGRCLGSVLFSPQNDPYISVWIENRGLRLKPTP